MSKIIQLMILSCVLYFQPLSAMVSLFNEKTKAYRILVEFEKGNNYNALIVKDAIKEFPSDIYYHAMLDEAALSEVSLLKRVLLVRPDQTAHKLLNCLESDCKDTVSFSELYKDLLTFLTILELFEVLMTDDLQSNLVMLKEQFMNDFNQASILIVQGIVSEDIVNILKQSGNNPLIISSIQTQIKQAMQLSCSELKKKLSARAIEQLITLLKKEDFGLALIYMQILWALEQKGASQKIVLVVDPDLMIGMKKLYEKIGYKEVVLSDNDVKNA